MSGLAWLALLLFLLFFAGLVWLVHYSQRQPPPCECHLLSPKAREKGAHCLACHQAKRCGCRFTGGAS